MLTDEQVDALIRAALPNPQVRVADFVVPPEYVLAGRRAIFRAGLREAARIADEAHVDAFDRPHVAADKIVRAIRQAAGEP